MDWNVEIRISPIEIANIGKVAALKRARLHAWLRAVQDTAPERSIKLVSEEAGDRYETPFLLLRFAVDE